MGEECVSRLGFGALWGGGGRGRKFRVVPLRGVVVVLDGKGCDDDEVGA